MTALQRVRASPPLLAQAVDDPRGPQGKGAGPELQGLGVLQGCPRTPGSHCLLGEFWRKPRPGPTPAGDWVRELPAGVPKSGKYKPSRLPREEMPCPSRLGADPDTPAPLTRYHGTHSIGLWERVALLRALSAKTP